MSLELNDWDSFYGKLEREPNDALNVPSDFAKYLTEIIDEKNIILDIGAGQGRDSKYFATLGHCVIAVDQSLASVEIISGFGHPNLKGVQIDISSKKDLETLRGLIFRERSLESISLLIYCRFLAHAIDRSVLMQLIQFAEEIMLPNELIVFEHRAMPSEKYTFNEHFRKPIRNEEFITFLNSKFFQVLYEIESFGLAIYGEEDPLIARLIVKRI